MGQIWSNFGRVRPILANSGPSSAEMGPDPNLAKCWIPAIAQRIRTKTPSANFPQSIRRVVFPANAYPMFGHLRRASGPQCPPPRHTARLEAVMVPCFKKCPSKTKGERDALSVRERLRAEAGPSIAARHVGPSRETPTPEDAHPAWGGTGSLNSYDVLVSHRSGTAPLRTQGMLVSLISGPPPTG